MSLIRVYFVLVLLSFTACNFNLDTSNLEGVYVSKFPFGTDKIQLMRGGVYHQWVSIVGDSIEHEVSGSWQFDSVSNYISMENKMLVIDGFGKLRKDYATASNGLSFLPVWHKFLFGRICLGTDELTPFEKVE